MKVEIGKSVAKGSVIAPPSKSYAHRLLICGAMSGKSMQLENISASEDIIATIDCIRTLGGKVTQIGDVVRFEDASIFTADEKTFYCRESGSTIRFFIPIALAFGGKMKFYGAQRLLERGFSVYEDICKEQNIKLEYDDRYLALEGRLHSGEFNVKGNISSQFISGLMFALPMLHGDSTIRVVTELESRPYVDITINALKEYGIEIAEIEKNTFFIKGDQLYKPKSALVEGDYSNSAFLDAFNIFGGDVSVFGLNPSSFQGDRAYSDIFNELINGSPIVDISSCPDLGPIVFALAGALNGATVIGTARLKIKESDRCEAMRAELAKFGVQMLIYDNSVQIISPKKLLKPSEMLYGHNDHRIVMALSVISTLVGAVIDGAEAVSKSYPDFFETISSLGIEVKYEATEQK